MTVIPLVFSSLVVGIATSSGGRAVARIGARGIIVFVLLLIASGVVGALVAPPMLAHVAADPAPPGEWSQHSRAAARWLAHGDPDARGMARLARAAQCRWRGRRQRDAAAHHLRARVRPRAPLRRGTTHATAVTMLFNGIAECMLVIVRWLLAVAPLGVFALAVPLVARLGLSAVGALATYVVLVSVSAALFMALVLYPAAAWFGGISLRTFARAAAPAQAVAFASRSSLAALPALIETGRTRLDLPDEITSFFLPLATAVFRVGAALALTTGAIFIGRLYGVPISTSQLATIVATAIVTSFSIPGIPGGSIIAMVPVLVSVGLPVQGLGILLGDRYDSRHVPHHDERHRPTGGGGDRGARRPARVPSTPHPLPAEP